MSDKEDARSVVESAIGGSSSNDTGSNEKASSKWQNFRDSFKRPAEEKEIEYGQNDNLNDIEKANIGASKSPLMRDLKIDICK